MGPVSAKQYAAIMRPSSTHCCHYAQTATCIIMVRRYQGNNVGACLLSLDILLCMLQMSINDNEAREVRIN